MKKILITGLLSIVFQTIVFSQTEFGLNAGLSANWIRSNIGSINIPITPGFKVGMFVKRNIIHDAFTIGTGLDYSYLPSTGTYSVEYLNNYPGGPYFIVPDVICEYLNTDVYRFDFHQLSIPVSFRFNSKFVQPYCGMEFYFKQTQTYYDSSDEPCVTEMFGIGVLMGLNIPIVEQFNINIGYYHGFTVDWNAQINDVGWDMKNSHIETTLQYTFKKKRKD
ncbi:MAG: outer membrane beta-barrel protein [Bacteroidales bacterium]|nr:outer membrane beta-barrel protein [Bacteroidales bacterium]